MNCKALILGVDSRSGKDHETGKPWSMNFLNFVDTDNPAGSPCQVKIDDETPLSHFIENKMKIVNLVIFQNGKYLNFGGFAK